jgi:hypothetical protein
VAGLGRVGSALLDGNSDNRATSAQFQLNLQTGAELGNYKSNTDTHYWTIYNKISVLSFWNNLPYLFHKGDTKREISLRTFPEKLDITGLRNPEIYRKS